MVKRYIGAIRIQLVSLKSMIFRILTYSWTNGQKNSFQGEMATLVRGKKKYFIEQKRYLIQSHISMGTKEVKVHYKSTNNQLD